MKAQDLKNSILHLAMRGKLVEQREEEGTANELLIQIEEEKIRLIKEGQFKKQKLPEIKEGEIPFEIPKSWAWIRLGELINISSGKGLTSKQMKVGEIPVFGGNGITGYHNIGNVDKETVVIGRVGYYCGSVHVTPKNAWVTDNAFITTYPESHIYKKYLVYVLRHLNLGRDNNATAQPVVSGKKIYPILFPLPPLEEQKRIVAKIEELMPYVEKYDRAYSEVEELNKKFPDDMQKSILQYATQGKLTEQREEEGTAEEVYRQIQEVKAKLIKEGKIKKSKKLPEITEDEIPFDKPDSWKFMRLGDVVEFQGGNQPPKSTFKDTFQEGYIRLIQIRDFKTDTFKTYIPYDKAKRFFNEDDIMIGRYGPPVFQILRGLSGAYNVALMKAKPNEELLTKDFLFYLLKAPFIQSPVIEESSRTAGQSGVRKELIESFVVGIPPLSEQKRIVDKIEEMNKLTDRMKSSLNI